jgi:hypothetical protein
VWVTGPGLGFVLAACGHSFSGTTLAQQVTNWASSASPTLSASVSAIQGDIGRIDAVRTDPAKPSPADCDLLVTDVLNTPTPATPATTASRGTPDSWPGRPPNAAPPAGI